VARSVTVQTRRWRSHEGLLGDAPTTVGRRCPLLGSWREAGWHGFGHVARATPHRPQQLICEQASTAQPAPMRVLFRRRWWPYLRENRDRAERTTQFAAVPADAGAWIEQAGRCEYLGSPSRCRDNARSRRHRRLRALAARRCFQAAIARFAAEGHDFFAMQRELARSARSLRTDICDTVLAPTRQMRG